MLVERFISNIKKEVFLGRALMNGMWRRRDYDGSKFLQNSLFFILFCLVFVCVFYFGKREK